MPKKTLSLREFYNEAPGELPPQACLPSRPGEQPRIRSVIDSTNSHQRTGEREQYGGSLRHSSGSTGYDYLSSGAQHGRSEASGAEGAGYHPRAGFNRPGSAHPPAPYGGPNGYPQQQQRRHDPHADPYAMRPPPAYVAPYPPPPPHSMREHEYYGGNHTSMPPPPPPPLAAERAGPLPPPPYRDAPYDYEHRRLPPPPPMYGPPPRMYGSSYEPYGGMAPPLPPPPPPRDSNAPSQYAALVQQSPPPSPPHTAMAAFQQQQHPPRSSPYRPSAGSSRFSGTSALVSEGSWASDNTHVSAAAENTAAAAAPPAAPPAPAAQDQEVAAPGPHTAVEKQAEVKEASLEPAATEDESTEVPLVTLNVPSAAAGSQPVVRNSFAERMAQQALARLAIKGTAAGSSSGTKGGLVHSGAASVSATSGASTPPVAVPPTASAQAAPVSPDADNNSMLRAARLSAVPLSRPTTAASSNSLSSDSARSVETCGTLSDRAPAAVASAASATSGDSSARPRLKLQPRSLPLDQSAVPAAAARASLRTDSDTASRSQQPSSIHKSGAPKSSSVFGAARPREEVLRQRGVVDTSALLDMDSSSGGGARGSHHGYTPASGQRATSRATSVASGFSDSDHKGAGGDQWQTVGPRKSKLSQEPEPYFGGNAALHELDPFFGSSNNLSGVRSGSSFHRNSYGNDGYTSRFKDAEYDSSFVDDGPVIKRALPVRSVY